MKRKELRTTKMQIMVTKTEADTIAEYFEKRGIPLSSGVRMVLLELINKEPGNG